MLFLCLTSWRESLRTRSDRKYLEQLLEVIHTNVIRCKWRVTRGVPYGDFAMSVVRELLVIKGIKFDGDDDLISAAHHIAGKMEEKSNG